MGDNAHDLVEFTAGATALLPKNDHDEGYHFLRDTVPVLPETLETGRLIVTNSSRSCESWRIDQPQVFGDKDVFEALGVITAGVLLSSQSHHVEIQLTHPESEVRSLIVEYPRYLKGGDRGGLNTIPNSFVYCASSVKKHPWFPAGIVDPYTFPTFELTNDERCQITEKHWLDRDVIVGFGSDSGTARMIQLFLDMSRPGNKTTEVVLESESGFRGVSPLSTEISFWLPDKDRPFFNW